MIVTLKKKIINLLGSKGKTWLNNLPVMIEKLSMIWSLTDITPVNNMSWNYVATARMNNKNLVVLKISSDPQLIADEYQTLQYWQGHGAIRVIDYHSVYHAVLLERAMPGTSLKEYNTENSEKTIEIYADVVKKIADKPLPKDQHYKHVSDWLKALDRITDLRIKPDFVACARALRLQLLKTTTHEYLCHGDLHLDNIIQQDFHWLAIDPKGIIGEMAFEAAAFDLIDQNKTSKHSDIQALILEQITSLAQYLSLDRKRLLAWVFLKIILSAQWHIEDNGDPSNMLAMAEYVYPLLTST